LRRWFVVIVRKHEIRDSADRAAPNKQASQHRDG
jgi:hypothetical protein